MIIKDEDYGKFEVSLGDDGTMDTVIVVDPLNDKAGQQEIRFSTEYGAEFRDEDGAITDESFKELTEEAVEVYIEQYLTCI